MKLNLCLKKDIYLKRGRKLLFSVGFELETFISDGFTKCATEAVDTNDSY